MIEVRRSDEADLPALVEILRAVQDTRGYPSAMPADPVTWLRGPRLLVSFVALVEGALAGQVSLAAGPGDRAAEVWSGSLHAPEEELGVIKRLFVEPARERSGVGRALRRRAVEEAHVRGLWPVLDVVSESEGPLRLYEKEGFSLVGEVSMSWPGSGGPVAVSCLAGPPPPRRQAAQ